jgi:Na+/H+-translocating membrane pyrophosphatase
MSMTHSQSRVITDELDAVGNVTKAATKGFAVGGSALACFLLFRAYLDEVSAITGLRFTTINIAKVEVLIGGMLGVMMVFVFTGWAMAAVGATAQDVVQEVRRQIRQRPGILEGVELPRYGECTEIVTKAALRQMVKPCVLALGLPVVVGITFRFIAPENDPLLAAEVLGGYMMFGSVSALLMAMFLDNSGGAWDNAKKWIESGAFGDGKGSETHKAAVTGDTVGDPFKDTAGPSLHVLITTMSTTILLLSPLFIN